jgi:hypothetical protein
MKQLSLTVMAILLSVGSALADSNNICITFYESRGLEITENVSFSGPQIIINDWVISHDTITIQFNSEQPIIWDRAAVGEEGLPALGDWIETALTHEVRSGIPAFAARSEDGYVLLVSTMADPDNFWNGRPCFGHSLY